MQKLQVLGGITAEEFLTEYWQKKPLLVKNAMPEINNLLEPDDIFELATENGVSARLLTQHGTNHEQWQVKNSPLAEQDLKNVPELWTLLVQAVDHFSPDIANLWQHFNFIPQWRRDDIMVSYAPKGGSVGKHYDQYDVFLVQGYGQRRWQLGQYCTPDCEVLPDQPLRLLADLDICFDEILEPGDLLYVPPTLAHYGVAQDDCLTFSFGFRMPNATQIMDELTDQLLDKVAVQIPVADHSPRKLQAAGEVTTQDIELLKQQLVELIQNSKYLDDAVLGLLSESKYADTLPENERMSADEMLELLNEDATIQREPAVRLLYTYNQADQNQAKQNQANQSQLNQNESQLQFWALGEPLIVTQEFAPILKKLADGAILQASDIELTASNVEQLCQLYADSILLIYSIDEDWQDE